MARRYPVKYDPMHAANRCRLHAGRGAISGSFIRTCASFDATEKSKLLVRIYCKSGEGDGIVEHTSRWIDLGVHHGNAGNG